MKVGIVGTGRMGTAVAHRLLDLGHDVLVWNRTAYKAHEAHEAGAVWTPILRDLARESEIILSFLYDDAAVERVYLGPQGLLGARVEGRAFIDMSTVTAGVHERISAAARARGAAFLECPVSGSVAAAQSGSLVGFAGGSSADVARTRPLLAQVCRRVEHIGPIGSGARMKLAANLLLAVFWQTLGESLALIDDPAVDAGRVIDLLADSNIGAAILRNRAPQVLAALKGATVAHPAFDVDTMRKDLRYIAQEADLRKTPLPLASRTLECFDRAASEGMGGLDSVAYPAFWIARGKSVNSGVERRHSGAVAAMT